MNIKRNKFLFVYLFGIIIFFSLGMLYGQYHQALMISTENMKKMDNQLIMMDNMENSSPFYSKKVIIRDDDVGNSSYLTSLKWLSDLCIEERIKLTYAVIPSELNVSPETITYLNNLNSSCFEFATHGFEHIIFKGLPYEEQYSFIKNGTEIIESKLNCTPRTFVPPKGSGDVNTTKACRILGYYSITDMVGYPSYIVDFRSDFEWEQNYNPISHHNFSDFKINFNQFYNSSDEYYIIYMHDWTFLDENRELDHKKTEEFEKALDYMMDKNVQFMTIDEAYRWHIDENSIRTAMIDNSSYFIDLRECRYNHTIKFSSPQHNTKFIFVTDIDSGAQTKFLGNTIEFNGVQGYWYEVSINED